MNRLIRYLLVTLVLCAAGKLSAQGTTFSYQGQLTDGGAPANGSYDLRFAVYDAVTNGNRVSLWRTNYAVSVSNGLFTTTLNFGSGIFTGTNYWLDIAVKATNVTSFTALVPRQPILPVPYAIFANGASNVLGPVSAAQLSGTVGSSQISGTYANTVTFSSGGNSFSGTFSGAGSNLVSLNASQLTSGTVADARLSSNVALLDHNQMFSGGNNFTNWANSFTGSFFGNGLVGWITTSAQSVQAQRDHGYMLTSAGLATVTLPPNSGLTNGDIVRVSGAGGGWLVAENSGQVIMGNLTSYRYGHLVGLTGPDPIYGVAASADGSRIYAVGNFNGVQLSMDYGKTWGQDGLLAAKQDGVACSADGMTVYIASTTGTIQESTNGGVSWFPASGSATNVACSADGTQHFPGQFTCSGDGTYRAAWTASSISVTTDGGGSYFGVGKPAGTLNCVAASSDCSRLVAGINNGLLYASANQGATWTALTQTNQYWTGVWMSPDGTRIVAAAKTYGVSTGGLYSSEIGTLPNIVSTNSTIGGGQGCAVELQYIGSGRFIPVSSSGVIWAN